MNHKQVKFLIGVIALTVVVFNNYNGILDAFNGDDNKIKFALSFFVLMGGVLIYYLTNMKHIKK